jgi:hypothetical protein
VAQYEPAAGDWFSQAAQEFDDDEEADEYAGRAQSGTMFKAIKVEGEQDESAAENVRPLRRAR